MTNSRNRLSDPVSAARAWARFRWIMRWVIATAMFSVAAALAYLWADGSPLTVAVVVATSAGVSLSVLLAGALMALIFMSSGSGHDEDVGRSSEDLGDRWDRRP
ncbi:hypothetical protein [Rhizorhabdus dicambivorans]|nr:hypothetical protein [Rhizorhabdus dicambivorans]